MDNLGHGSGRRHQIITKHLFVCGFLTISKQESFVSIHMHVNQKKEVQKQETLTTIKYYTVTKSQQKKKTTNTKNPLCMAWNRAPEILHRSSFNH